MSGELISTRDSARKKISYTDALLEGLAPDGGLYVPVDYPQLTMKDLSKLQGMSYVQLAFEIKKRLVGGSIPDKVLMTLVENAYSKDKFDFEDGNVVPVRAIGEDLFLQNLSLGPTAAFKDMALQQLAQEMNYELDRRDEDLVILGATSGDTGSSAEAAVKGLDRIKLFMLSPQKGMSDFQKAQMGALTGGNIFNIGVDGRFDDCQDLVKELKRKPEFAKLGAVNSINWGRISSQVPYFVSGYLQVVSQVGQEVDFVVPTGNFGNVLSGYIAKRMGVPIRKLIVATNENDVMARLIETGVYESRPSQVTSSPSMDISKASNYERLVFDLLGRDAGATLQYMKEFTDSGRVDMTRFGLDSGVFVENGFVQGSSTHRDRVETIRLMYDEYGIVIDPHTADAVAVGTKHKVRDGVPMVVMETALPVKFEDTIAEAIGFVPKREARFKGFKNDGGFYDIAADAWELERYIRDNV
jgi:threonine synthase